MKITITVEVSSPDEAKVIIDRMSRTTNAWTDLQEARDELAAKEVATRSTCEEKMTTADIKPSIVIASEDVAARANVSPGTPLITKIGKDTTDAILLALKEGIPQPSVKYKEHLKLLWKRGVIKFDGKEYYL